MSIDHSRAVIQHHCDPPDVYRFEYDDAAFNRSWPFPPPPSVTLLHPVGTRFTCDVCLRLWEVWQRPPGGNLVGGKEWRLVPWWRRLSWGGRFAA